MTYTFSYIAATPQNHITYGMTDAESVESLRERLLAVGCTRVSDIKCHPRFEGDEAAYMMWMLEEIGYRFKSKTEGETLSPYFLKLAQMLGYISDEAKPRLYRKGKKYISMCHDIGLIRCADIPERGRWMMEEEVKGENNVAMDWRTLLAGL